MSMFSWIDILAQTRDEVLPSDSVTGHVISIDFRMNSCDIDSAYSVNTVNLHALQRLLDETRNNPYMEVDSVKVSGYASPDGSLPKNLELSRLRAEAIRTYINKNCGVDSAIVKIGGYDVPWDRLRDIISASGYPWRSDAMHILAAGSDHDACDNALRMLRIKKLEGGKAWDILKRDILPQLRSAYVVTTVITCIQPVTTQLTTAQAESADTVTVTRPVGNIEAPVRQSAPVIVDEAKNIPFAIKTNAAYLAAGVTNIGAEMALNDKWSVDVPLVYSPYTLARNYRLRFLYVQPEVRFWLSHALKGHFLGVHAHVGVANVSLDNNDRYQTPDGFYGGGISYGYSLPIAKRWSVEFTIGAGYFFTKYDVYHNTGIPTGQRYEKGKPLNYWGIDKVGVNIIYRFGAQFRGNKSVKGKEVVSQ